MQPPSYRSRFEWLFRLTVYVWLNVVLFVTGLGLSLATSGWMQSVGTSVLASSLVGLLFIYQLRIDRQFDDARRMYDDFGLLAVTSERSNKELYARHMQRCQVRFDIIGHSLSRLYDDLARDLLPLMDHRGVKIRILLLDPESVYTAGREREEPSPERVDLKAETRKAAQFYRALSLKNAEIRFYDATPTVAYQLIDNLVFAGPYFVGLSSGREPALMLRANDRLALSFQKHFENIWKSYSRPADVDEPRKSDGD